MGTDIQICFVSGVVITEAPGCQGNMAHTSLRHKGASLEQEEVCHSNPVRWLFTDLPAQVLLCSAPVRGIWQTLLDIWQRRYVI